MYHARRTRVVVWNGQAGAPRQKTGRRRRWNRHKNSQPPIASPASVIVEGSGTAAM
jgi:hypothetical protein